MEILKPIIRFSEFQKSWEKSIIKDIVNRYTEAVKVDLHTQYRQIGIRSHGKGLFYKNLVSGETLGNKRVFWIIENALIINIVFAWEQAVTKTTEKEKGMIASHRFPMYLPLDNKSNVDFLNYFFLTKKGKFLLESASPGGAGRNKTLGQKEFDNSKIIVPSIQEQTRIANFLSAVDEKLNLLKEKKDLLEEYKKGIMQKIFNQELRFKDDNGNDYEEWDNKTLGEVAKFRRGSFPQPYGLPKWYDDENGMPFIQVYDVGSNMLLKDKTKNRISKIGAEQSVFVEKGTIVITIQGSIGRIAKTQYDAYV
ncbi:MAG: restriction endonuclease subunit S, partial [Bacteroidetes bacterium]|nr:restriction endonuclease subunit S [Bacteroidota bacterium]